MIVYNLFPLLAGRFGAWRAHVERAASMGFDWLFVNPIQRPGASGSIYSVAHYFQLNPRLVDPASHHSPDDQVRQVIGEANQRGLRVMVDLVINHCAADAELVRRHPRWFRRQPDGTIAHPFCLQDGRTVVWKDLARFDHRHTSDPQGLHRFFLEVVDYLVGLGFQGFRCDAAYQVPSWVWRQLIDEVKARWPGTVFVAETLGCTAYQTRETAAAGFDYVFNSVKWWDFRSPWLLEQYQLTREAAPSIGFPESHDTSRLAEEVGGNVAALKLRYLFAALFSAGCMAPVGFEFGFRRPLHVVTTRPEEWEPLDVDLRGFIGAVNRLKAAHQVFREDGPTLILPTGNPGVLAMWKASTTQVQEALIFLNTDAWNPQHLHVDNLDSLRQTSGRLVDVSPEHRSEQVGSPLVRDLQPGAAVVLLAEEPNEGE